MICEPIKKSLEFMSLYNVQSILEIGCGRGGIISQFYAPTLVGVDNWEPALIKAKQEYSRPIFLKHDVTHLRGLFIEKSFDAVIGFDILEHLPNEDMVRAVEDCEEFAKKLVLFFSPLDEEGLNFHPVPEDSNPGMSHVTIIREGFFVERGYITHIYPGYHENGATAMLAIKEL
jgi:SAM-dependent methyltransferase